MTYSNLQLRTLRYDLLHLLNLFVTISQGDRQDCTTLLHEMEHPHHLFAVKRSSQQSVAWYCEPLEAFIQKCLRMLIETILKIVNHSEYEETLWISSAYLGKIVILDAIDKLLNHHGCRHLGIVHITEKHLGRVLAVDNKGRDHLYLFTKEDRTSVT